LHAKKADKIWIEFRPNLKNWLVRFRFFYWWFFRLVGESSSAYFAKKIAQ
jgi:hypothetical protein